MILWVDWAQLGGFPAAHGVFLDCSPLGWNVQDGRPHGSSGADCRGAQVGRPSLHFDSPPRG